MVEDVVWRQLGRHLWVGRSGDVHIGIIEEGRRFTLTDANDFAHPGFGSLEAAKSATGSIPVAAPGALAVPSAESRLRRWRKPSFMGVSTAALLFLSVLLMTVIGLGASIFTIR